MGPLVYSGYPPRCPPDEAVPASGEAYRITQHSPPTDDDFKSQLELGWQPKYPLRPAKECKYRSLSIYRTVADARHHLAKYAAHGRYVAAGVLRPETGVTLATPTDFPTHTEWWCADGCDRGAGFHVIEGRDDVGD